MCYNDIFKIHTLVVFKNIMGNDDLFGKSLTVGEPQKRCCNGICCIGGTYRDRRGRKTGREVRKKETSEHNGDWQFAKAQRSDRRKEPCIIDDSVLMCMYRLLFSTMQDASLVAVS